MKPIVQQRSCDNMDDIRSDGGDLWISYKPVYKQPVLPSFRTGNDISNGSVPSRSYEYINLLKNESTSDDNSASTSRNCE